MLIICCIMLVGDVSVLSGCNCELMLMVIMMFVFICCVVLMGRLLMRLLFMSVCLLILVGVNRFGIVMFV